MVSAAWLARLRTGLGPAKASEFLDRFVAVRRECDGLRRQVWRLVASVVLVSASSLAVVALAMAMIVPDLGALFDASGLRSNRASQVLQVGAGLGRPFWLSMTLLLLLLGHAPWLFRRHVWGWLPRSPWLGSVWQAIDDAQWSRLTALAISAGESLPQALRLGSDLAAPSQAAVRGLRWAARLQAAESWTATISTDPELPASWRLLLQDGGTPPLSAWQQIAAMRAGWAGARLTLLRAAVWPVVWFGGFVAWLAVARAICGPVLTYLRSWA